jgi:acetyl esterase/lipase
MHIYPVIIYAHGLGGTLMNDGNDLRQMAELGLAVVSLDYNQSNEVAFSAQFESLLFYLGRQKWADTNAFAWVGYSLGANQMLDFALQHPEQQPQLLIQLNGIGIPESHISHRSESFHCPVLLIHGDQDEIFRVADTKRLASVFQTNGVPAELKIIPGLPHGLEPDRGVVFRCIGEYCRSHLSEKNEWQDYHSIAQWQAEAPALWLFWLPAMAWVSGWPAWWWYRKSPASEIIKLKRHEVALRWLAVSLAILALAETALHLIPPHLLVSYKTLSIARHFLVQPKELGDFEHLAAQPIWHGQKLKTLLDHVELAIYNRELINWQLDDKIYQDFVLSSVITGKPGELMNWRPPLWEEFYPRIRHESSPDAAAKIVVRHLRERVTIASFSNSPQGVPAIWLKQITDETGFEIIYVAALRSVGVPARLDSSNHAEFWDGNKWQPAPSPSVLSW